jgi:Flp pilus assembly protein TadD
MLSGRGRNRLLFIFAAALLMLVLLGFWRLFEVNPDNHYLPARGPARWIVYPTPPNGDALRVVSLSTLFRRSFRLESVRSPARLSICGFKEWSVLINGQAVQVPERAPTQWKAVTELEVSGYLNSGTNEISVEVSSADGLPALWLSLSAGGLVLNTDENWQVSFAGAAWRPGELASKPAPINEGSLLFSSERPLPCFLARLPLLLCFVTLAGFLLPIARWWLARTTNSSLERPAVLPGKELFVCAAALVVAWIVLWVNNAGALPKLAGFDAAEHLAYIKYILDKHALPLANEGWEMFQPPFYYLASAAQLAVLHLSTSDAAGILALRWLGLACGITTFVLVILSVRLLMPDRPQAQLFGLLLGALLPVNLYLSHYPTNENLALTLVAASLYVSFRIFQAPRVRFGWHSLLGLLLGAALLTKSSTLLAFPIIFLALAWNLQVKQIRGLVRWTQHLGLVALLAAATAGWHYWRTAAHFHNPLMGNWNPASGFRWWQEPGYRTIGYYLHFGQCFSHPFYSGFTSLGDGLYSTLWGDGLWGGQVDVSLRPPWNYDLMAAGYLLALLPTVAILAGIVATLIRFLRSPRPEDIVVLGLPFLAGIALLYYSLQVPVYASAKAFYASSALLPLCMLGARGWNSLTQRAGRCAWLLWFPLLVWCLNVYASFWIHRSAPATRLLMARGLASDGFHDRAFEEFSRISAQYPGNATAAQLFARALVRQGLVAQANEKAEESVRLAPEDAEAHLLLGTILASQGKTEQAIAQAKRAVELAPDHPRAASSLFLWCYQSGRKEEARTACAESLRVNPFSPEFHYGMAVVSNALGDKTNAAIHFRLASQLKQADSPDHLR